jgi:hypothetical protein
MDPTKLFVSDKHVTDSLALLKDFKEGGRSASEEELWEARATKETLVHPDTGELLPRWATFAAYVPAQPPLIIGLCWPNPGVATVLFWPWANQSFNAAVNYPNRNAAGDLTESDLLQAYGGAVAISCSVALGMGKLAAKFNSKALRLLVPLTSVCCAGGANLFMMRSKELEVQPQSATCAFVCCTCVCARVYSARANVYSQRALLHVQ